MTEHPTAITPGAESGPASRRRRGLRAWLPALAAWALAAVFVLLAVYAVGGRVLLAELSGAEQRVGAALAEKLGVAVRIEQLEGRFRVLHPVIEARSIALLPDGTEPALRMGGVRIEVDVMRSLLHRTLVPAAFVVEELEVVLERGRDGRFGLYGAAIEADIALLDILDFLFLSGYAELRSGHLLLHLAGAEARRPEEITLAAVLERQFGEGTGHVTMEYLAAEAEEAALGELHYRLPGRSLGEMFGALLRDPLGQEALPRFGPEARRPYRQGAFLLQAESVRVGRFVSELIPDLPPLDGTLDDLRLRGEVHHRHGLHVVLDARSPELRVGSMSLDRLEFGLSGSGIGAAVGALAFERVRAHVDAAPLALDGLRLGWEAGETTRQIWLDGARFSAEPLGRLLRNMDVLPAEARQWLEELDPGGQVIGGRVLLEPEHERFALAARVQGLRMNAVRGAPAVDGADLDLVLFERGGWIDLDSGPFALHFPQLFPAGWNYEEGRGRVDIRFGDGTTALRGQDLRISGDGLNVRGAFALFLPAEAAERQITLMLGLGAGDAGLTREYLPARLQPGLRAWLLDGVRAGQVRKGGVVVSGPLIAGAGGPLRPELFFEVEQGSLAFDPRWPVATELAGSLYVERSGFSGRIEQAELGGLTLTGVDLDFPAVADGLGLLQVTGTGRSSGMGAIGFLRQIPIEDPARLLDEDWQAAGEVDFDFNLALPLDGRPPERIDVDLALALGHLHVPMTRQDIHGLSGNLAYRHPGGVSARRLEGDMFSGPAALRIEGGVGAGHEALAMHIAGVADASEVAAWSTVDTLIGARGELDYEVELTIAGDGAVDLGLRSGAENVSTGLPEPLDRAAGPLLLDLFVPPGDDWELAFSWGEHSGAFRLRDREFVAGTMGIGLPSPELPGSGLRARGHAQRIDLAAWFGALADIEASAVARGRPRTRIRTAADLDLELDLGEVIWDDTELGPARLDIKGSTVATELRLASEPLTGRVRAELDAPLDVELEWLRLPLGDGTDAWSLEDLQPESLMDMDVRIEALEFSGEEIGAIAFKLRTDARMLSLEDIDGSIRGVRLEADPEGRSRMEWRVGARPQTRYLGRLSGRNSSAVMAQWGVAPTLDAEAFEFDLDLAWPGGPMALSPEILDGRIRMDVERGRFVQLEAGTAPLRVVGLFNFGAIARRMRLDFTDLYKRGMAFDEIDGVLDFDSGTVRSAEPIRIIGPGSSFRIGAELDLVSERLDGDIIVTLPVSRNLPWYAAYAILLANPITGAGVFVAERVFRDQIDRFSSARYRLSGSLDEPDVTFVSIFADEVDLPVRLPPDEDPDLDWLLEDPFLWPDEYPSGAEIEAGNEADTEAEPETETGAETEPDAGNGVDPTEETVT